MFVSEIKDWSNLRVLKNGAAVCEPEKWEAMEQTEMFDRRMDDYDYGKVWVNGIPRKIK